MKRTFLASLMICAVLHTLQAQEMPKQCSVYMPSAIDKNLIYDTDAEVVTVSPYGQTRKPAQGKGHYWNVFSDRDNNPTYAAPSTSSKKLTPLEMNDRVTIVQIQKGFALVIQDEKQGIWPEISPRAVMRGWVPMSNLLLWDSCPANQYGIYHKAVTCLNAGAKNIQTSNKSKLLGKLFRNPDEDPSGKLKADMRFYFVMKREGGKALLAKEYKMSATSHVDLYGWVDESSFVPWDQRECLEPNWDINDAEFFADKGIKALVYRTQDKKDLLVSIKFRKSSKARSDVDPFMYRMDPYLLRYPILSGGNDKQFFCTAFANPGTGIAPVDAPALSPEYNKLNDLLQKRRKVKIAIVIDGTKSMEPYFEPVYNAVRDGIKYFQDKTVEVGAVIFRDKEDGPNSKYAAEAFGPVDIRSTKLNSFFMNGGEYGIKSDPRDRDKKEAVYYGISTALDKFHFDPQESNIMIVIGDCADNGKMGISDDDLIRRLVKSNVSFMSFQVRNQQDDKEDAYQDFNDQMLKIMKGVIQGRYDADRMALSESSRGSLNLRVGANYVHDSNLGEGFDIRNSGGYTNLYIGSHRNPRLGMEMPGGALITQMDAAFGNWNKSIQAIEDRIKQLAQGDADLFEVSPDSKVNEDVLANKAAIVNLIGEDTYNVVSRNNTLMGFPGYTDKVYSSGSSEKPRQMYKTVVFISHDELSNLISKLAPLYKVAADNSSSRVEYVNALKAIVRSLNPGITEQQMNEMKASEVMTMLTGLPVQTRAMSKYTIPAIADPQQVKQNDYMSMVKYVVTKYNKLIRTQGSTYMYSRNFDGVLYYWLPIEDLP